MTARGRLIAADSTYRYGVPLPAALRRLCSLYGPAIGSHAATRDRQHAQARGVTVSVSLLTALVRPRTEVRGQLSWLILMPCRVRGVALAVTDRSFKVQLEIVRWG